MAPVLTLEGRVFEQWVAQTEENQSAPFQPGPGGLLETC